MPLFTDGPIATMEDLRAYESSILDLAGTEGVDLTAKLAVAQREIGLEIIAFLLRNGAGTGAARALSQVVVTEPLLHLHALTSLAATYRDAYNSQHHDRYQGKWKEYARLSSRALDLLFDIGVGLTYRPIPKAARPVVETTLGGMLPASTYYISVAWLDDHSITGVVSDPAVVSCDPGQILIVAPQAAPSGAAGWTVYAGPDPQSLRRQTEAQMAIGQPWLMPPTGLRVDLPDLPVQRPETYCANGRGLMRG